MSKCECSICKINIIIGENFGSNNCLSKQLGDIFYSSEIISTYLKSIMFNALNKNEGVVSDESLIEIKEITAAAISTSQVLSKADLSQVNDKQASIYREYNLFFTNLAKDATAFLDEAILITNIRDRCKFVGSHSNFLPFKYSDDCLARITVALNGIAAPQLG